MTLGSCTCPGLQQDSWWHTYNCLLNFLSSAVRHQQWDWDQEPVIKGKVLPFGQMSAPTTWIWDPFGLPRAWEKIQLSLEYSPCFYIVMKKSMTTGKVLVCQGVLYHENKIPENLMPCQANYRQRQKSLLVVKHAVNLCFSLPLASKTVPTLGIVYISLYCQLTQNSNYWFRCWWGVGGGDELLPLPSLNFPCFPHVTLSLLEDRQHRQLGSGSCSFLLCLPYSFSPHLILPAPPRTKHGPTDVSPVMVPFQMSPPALLVAAALPQACVGLAVGAAYWHSMGHPTASLKSPNSHPKPSLTTKPQKPGLL